MPTLDIFAADAFKLTQLTDAINKLPFVPGRLGQLGLFQTSSVTTTSIMIEQKAGVLTMVSPSPRGGPGETIGKQKRSADQLTIPHFQRDDVIMADEVQGVRAFGSETELETVMGKVAERMAEHVTSFDATEEYARVGAMKGVVTYSDGSTLDLFAKFGVTQESEVDFDLDNATPASGALRKVCAGVMRTINNNLGGVPSSGVGYAICGDAFFDDLLAHPEVVASYRNTPMAEVLRNGYVLASGSKIHGAFEFGGIVWENYRGAVGSTSFVHTDKCHIAPLGVPGLFRTVYGPADYIETVNTIGRRLYAKQIPMRNEKGIDLEMQMNALQFCTRPKVLIKGKRT